MRTRLRRPVPGDVGSLEDAERLCFVDPWPGHFFATEMFAPGRFNRLLVDPSGRLVAYLFSVWQYLDLHVLKVATLPVHRRLGLARGLMLLAEEHASEMGGELVTLEVRTTNGSAIALYRSLGYDEAGRRPRYYSDGEDAVVMTRRALLWGEREEDGTG